MKPSPGRRVEILLDSHGPDVTGAAPVEIARGAMMKRVFPPPVLVWRERQNTGDEADNVVRAPGAKVRAVRAVMKDDEDAHQERRGYDRQRNGEPYRDLEHAVHRIPQEQVRTERVRQLP